MRHFLPRIVAGLYRQGVQKIHISHMCNAARPPAGFWNLILPKRAATAGITRERVEKGRWMAMVSVDRHDFMFRTRMASAYDTHGNVIVLRPAFWE
jgi:hypothetical protein